MYAVDFDGAPTALKLFSAEVSPDGRAQDEVAISAAVSRSPATARSGDSSGGSSGDSGGGDGDGDGGHPSLPRVLALVYDRRGDAWPDPDEGRYDGGDGSGQQGQQQQQQQQQQQDGQQQANNGGAGGGAAAATTRRAHAHEAAKGLVRRLVAGAPLALKPTSEHLLRCKWAPGAAFAPADALAIAAGVAGALRHLHARRVCHGDVYAHNVLWCREAQRAVLVDLGAAFCYHEGEEFWEAMEVRAYGLFLSDIAARVEANGGESGGASGAGGAGGAGGAAAAAAVRRALADLAERCAALGAEARPRFAAVVAELEAARRLLEPQEQQQQQAAAGS